MGQIVGFTKNSYYTDKDLKYVYKPQVKVSVNSALSETPDRDVNSSPDVR